MVKKTAGNLTMRSGFEPISAVKTGKGPKNVAIDGRIYRAIVFELEAYPPISVEFIFFLAKNK